MRELLAAVTVALALPGCSGPALRASSLPPDYRVTARPNAGAINLASLASPGAAESRIDAGDLLEITVASGRDEEKPEPVLARVSDTGAAEIPLVGNVQLGGLEPFEASQAIASAAVERGIYRRPHVALEIKTKAVNRVTVMGAVTTPGVHELPRASSDLVKALAMAGGLTDEAGTQVEIIRQAPPAATSPDGVTPVAYQDVPAPAPRTVRVDMASLTAQGDYRLSDRDMVMVLPRDKEMLYVTGLVTKPGQFELPRNQEVRLLDAIAMGGGVSSPVADKVLIIRRVPGRPDPAPIQASLRIAKSDGRENLVLGAGDVVSIEQTPATATVDALMRLIRLTVGVTGRTTVF
ncbi:MAG TPA: SLBB domain-containing protein [Lacipirellulaceae bacterium]|nr:SLBB domain-containing protein [Lacipirellulaceae bacterium]